MSASQGGKHFKNQEATAPGIYIKVGLPETYTQGCRKPKVFPLCFFLLNAKQQTLKRLY